MQTLHLFITGFVQGVGYRAWTMRTAIAMGIVGWVRNLPDGRVEVVAIGPKTVLDQFLTACFGGPTGSFVREIVSAWESVEGEYVDFKILV